MSFRNLQISSQLQLPLDAVTQTFAILGVRGTGKTNTGVVLVEELLSASQQVVVLDPVDVWWGLKSGRSSGPGFPVPVIGGQHGDVPLEATSGELIADFVVDNRASVIISVRHLTISEQRRFAGDFARRLYERKAPAEFRSPVMVVIDEADEFVPQRISPGSEAMFGAFDRIVRRGRSSGIGVTLISQRPQVLNKDVLTQMEILIAHRVLHKLDRKALEEWVAAHDAEGNGDRFLSSLSTLARGEAWVWSPSFLNIFKRVQIRARNTFDSSATPKAGEQQAVPRSIAKIDLDKLRSAMSETLERSKEDDPRELRRRIAQLERRLADVRPPEPETIEVPVEVPVIEPDHLSRLEEVYAQLGASIADVLDRTKTRETIPQKRETKTRETHTTSGSDSPGGSWLAAGPRAILTACAQYPEGCTREQLTILTGYKRSTRDAYLQRLSAAGLVKNGGAGLTAAHDGIAALGDFTPLPTGEALREYWLEKLPEGESKIFQVLISAFPHFVAREDLEHATGYKRSTRDAYLQRLISRRLVYGERGKVRAVCHLFPENKSP